jgi:hypothetical protein
MAKILQSNNFEEIVVSFSVKGLRFRVQIPIACAKTEFQVQDEFCAISSAVSKNLAQIEKAVWQKHETGGGTEFRLYQRDFSSGSARIAQPAILRPPARHKLELPGLVVVHGIAPPARWWISNAELPAR